MLACSIILSVCVCDDLCTLLLQGALVGSDVSVMQLKPPINIVLHCLTSISSPVVQQPCHTSGRTWNPARWQFSSYGSPNMTP